MEEKKEVIPVDEKELEAMLAQNKALQEKENAGDSIKADWLLLAKPLTKALQPSQKDLYIQGLSIGDIFIQKTKTNLGKTVDVIPLSFISLYSEREDTSANANFYGYWNKEQATVFPLVMGDYYNRQMPDGHILQPVHWVFVQVVGHPEIENGIISFKSTGSRIWKQWKDDAKSRSETSATLVYSIFEDAVQNAKNSWTDFGFAYKGNLLESDKAQALFCLKKSNKIREDYEKAVLVGNHDMSAINMAKDTKQIEADDEITF